MVQIRSYPHATPCVLCALELPQRGCGVSSRSIVMLSLWKFTTLAPVRPERAEASLMEPCEPWKWRSVTNANC